MVGVINNYSFVCKSEHYLYILHRYCKVNPPYSLGITDFGFNIPWAPVLLVLKFQNVKHLRNKISKSQASETKAVSAFKMKSTLLVLCSIITAGISSSISDPKISNNIEGNMELKSNV